MRLLIDSDAFCKLAICELLDDAAAVLGASSAECGRLPALAFMLRKGNLRRKLGAKADRKSTRLNSSHSQISYAVFCLKKKNFEAKYDGQIRTGTTSIRSRTLGSYF